MEVDTNSRLEDLRVKIKNWNIVNSPFNKYMLKDEEQKRKKKMSRMEGDANSRLEDLRDMRNSNN